MSKNMPFDASRPRQIRKPLVRLVPDEGNNHAVQIEEEHDEVKAELDERLLVYVSMSGHTDKRPDPVQ